MELQKGEINEGRRGKIYSERTAKEILRGEERGRGEGGKGGERKRGKKERNQKRESGRLGKKECHFDP
jgi:hypothetical protein